MKVDLYPGFRIRPIFQLFLQCSPWSVCIFSDVPIDGLQMFFCSRFCSSCSSYMTLSLPLRNCPEPLISRISTTPEMWPCWSQTYSKTARMGRFLLERGFMHWVQSILCVHSLCCCGFCWGRENPVLLIDPLYSMLP